MRNTVLILLISAFQVFASGSYAQTKTISLAMNDATISEVLYAIQNQSEFYFLYNSELIDVTKKVDVEIEGEKVDEILARLFSKEEVDFLIKDRYIILTPVGGNAELFAEQQQRTVSGKVTDSGGQPLPGATVVIKGTTQGTVTNADGEYSITTIPEDATLQFSFVGMRTQEVEVSNQSTIDVTMLIDAVGIEEVVAIGYGTQKKINLTGAVTSVKGEDLVRRPVTNVESMLQGRMPGVQIVQNSGEPGNEGVSIRVRGIGTFSSAGSDPLVLVDGVDGDLADLNPNDIENISVLKDAASASIYGARAANGVILVTTKKGKEGKITMEYNVNYAVHTPTKMFDLISNSAEYMELFNEARINSGLMSGLYTEEMISEYRNATDRNLYPNTDWLDLLFNPAPTHTHNLSFRGGKEGTTFNVSLGYVDQQGTMKGFEYKKYNARVNLASEVNDNIKFGGIFSLKKGEKSAPRSGGTDMFLSTMSQAPTYAPKLTDGSGRYTFKSYDFEYNNKNSIAIIENNVDRNTDDWAISSQGWLDIQLGKGLNWYTKGAINLDFSSYNDFRPKIPLYNFRTNEFMTYLNVGSGGEGLTNHDDQNIYTNVHTYLNFDRLFGAVHNVAAQIGYSMEENTYKYLEGFRKEYPKDNLRQLNAGSPSVQQAYGTKNEWALMSFFGRLGYNFNDRYLLEANLRYDGTSKLHSDSRWGAFPSFSAGWRISEEEFMQDFQQNWLTSLKIRGSYGELGNQNIGLYPYQAILDLTGNYSFDNANLSSGVAQTSLANKDIKWETTKITDFGFDMILFEGLELIFDWYKKRTTDILRSSQVTDLVGLGAPTINNGTMENTGVELALNYNNYISTGTFNGLNYSVGFNFDHYKNELVEFGEREISGYYIREEGQEWEAYYMLEWIGIFQSEEEINNSPKQFNDATVPGDLKWKDQNGDNVIDNDDRIIFPDRYPNFNYGINMTANWKGFDLSGQFQGVQGVKLFVNDWGTIPFVQGASPTTNWRDRWTNDNPSTTLPRIYWGFGAPQRVTRSSSWFLQDGSYFRLKNLTFGYTLPNNLTQRINMGDLRIYFSGDNLFTITDYPGLDPERAGSGSFVNYPQNKIYSFGANIKF